MLALILSIMSRRIQMGPPPTPGVFNYLRPGGVDTYLRPGGVDTYKRP